ncbi:hypothetical protein [Exiguobacterium sp. s5]|uniref:hypothetical protein n=1 Tax=Exiguobacterium sp. s5 TaxID=2751239 RepID=UPI001BE8CC41|nr:hypothetical protein [Exiguobacterium sp. s5]
MRQTYVKVGGVWKPCHNVWVKVAGVWRQRVVPKGIVAGAWRTFKQYVLTLVSGDTYSVSFVEYSSANAFIVPDEDHTHLEATANIIDPQEAYITTSSAYDLTPFNTLIIDWETIGNNIEKTGQLQVLNGSTVVASINTSTTFSRRTQSIDISGLTGPHSIRVRLWVNELTSAFPNPSDGTAMLDIYLLYME